MNLVEMKVKDFLDELASKSPAPGGGSVSALVGANAASLVLMVSELTVHKKKFKALDENIQKSYLEHIEIFKKNKDLFTQYVDDDTKAFNIIMDAYKMPKETEEQIELRNEEIQKATVKCIKVPMNVCLAAMESLRNIEHIISHSNKNAMSDIGVATLLLYSAFEGAAMNVLINLQGLDKKDLVKDYQDVIQRMTDEAKILREDLLEKVYYIIK